MTSNKPFIVIVPGASQNPTHYGQLSHYLQLAGYPTFSALLPSVGATGKVTAEDDADYVRDKMVIPILDIEEHDVIIFTHSYSGIPGSAAVQGFSKQERAAAGKKTGVLGQIHLATLLAKGGDGKDLVSAFGGHYPPHIRPDTDANLLRCDDRIPPLYADVPADLAKVVATAAMAQGMTSFTTPLPRATWDSDAHKGRVAYIRTTKDAAFPVPVQQMMIDSTGAEWIVKDIEAAHSAQISQPEKLASILVELAQAWENF